MTGLSGWTLTEDRPRKNFYFMLTGTSLTIALGVQSQEVKGIQATPEGDDFGTLHRG